MLLGAKPARPIGLSVSRHRFICTGWMEFIRNYRAGKEKIIIARIISILNLVIQAGIFIASMQSPMFGAGNGAGEPEK